MAYFFARLFGHKVGIRCEAPFYKEPNRPSFSKGIRKFVLGNLLFKYFIDFFFYIGNQNKIFYQYFKIKDNQLFYAPYAVDNERFMSATNLSDAERLALKQELKIPEQSRIVLFTGKFYSVKRPLDLLEAIKSLNQPDLYLVMVGDGILRPEMEEFIKTHNLTNVCITGFVNQTQIPAYYALADVLVLCSETETWGLSVNEAMCASLPIIVSNTVGCADDLVQNGVNGFIFEMGNVAQLSNAIKKVTEDKKFKLGAGKKSSEIIQNFTYQKVVDNILKAELSNE